MIVVSMSRYKKHRRAIDGVDSLLSLVLQQNNDGYSHTLSIQLYPDLTD